MTRRAAFRLALAAAVLVVAWLQWPRARPIETARADEIAKTMAVRYAAGTGEPVVHFGRARRITYPDGWEFIWPYRPCPDDAALRVFVPLDGRGARITEHPDCSADNGFGVKPTRT